MQRKMLSFLVTLAALLSVPFVYNSCQGGLGSKSFSSAKSSLSCKTVVQNGQVVKLKPGLDQSPGPFAFSKVALRRDLDSNSTMAKATGPVTVNTGTQLAAILNHECLDQLSGQQLSASVISKAAVASKTRIPGLESQIYLWNLDHDYTDIEIEDLANQEPCVVGVSWNKTYNTQAVFNDPYFSVQTHLTSIHATDAYTRFYSNGSGGMATTGSSNIIFAVIDTGVDFLHEDLQAQMWSHQYGIGIDIPSYVDGGVTNYNPFDISSEGHGTHTAGLIAAAGNNALGGIGAMPYRSKIMAIKVFKYVNPGTTDTSITTTSQYFYNGINFAKANGANVINVSLAAKTNGPASDTMAQTVLQDAVNSGAVVTIALGNSDSGQAGGQIDGTTLTSVPAIYSTISGVIGVGSYDVNSLNKSSFSLYSTTYGEVAAPGAETSSVGTDPTGLASTVPTALGKYGRLAGTSEATPLVAAAAGLTMGLIRNAYGALPTPQEVENLILSGSIKSAALAPYFKDGNRLDLQSLVLAINAKYPSTYTGAAAPLPVSTSGCP